MPTQLTVTRTEEITGHLRRTHFRSDDPTSRIGRAVASCSECKISERP